MEWSLKRHYKGQSVPYNANRKDEYGDKGHKFERVCPDRFSNGINMVKIGAAIKSGHRDKDADKHDVNGVSGHASGHDNTIKATICKANIQSGH